MQLISVNVARPRLLQGTARGDVMSAIHKGPVEGPVMVRRLNVDGDAQGDPTVHGGPDAAVYVYAFEDYAFWAAQLKREPPSFGWFGENLTVQGASSDAMCFGDVWRVGGALLQVTEPRSPCYKLDHKMGIRYFAARFRRSGRVGFYNRVLEEGPVQAGDEATIVEAAPSPHLHPAAERRAPCGRHIRARRRACVGSGRPPPGPTAPRGAPYAARQTADDAVTTTEHDLPYWIAFSRVPTGGARPHRPPRRAVRVAQGRVGSLRKRAWSVRPHLRRRQRYRTGAPGRRTGTRTRTGAQRRRSGAHLARLRLPAPLPQHRRPPPILYVKGTLQPDDEVRITVVGTRNPLCTARK